MNAPTTLTDEQIAAIRSRREKAMNEIAALCKGQRTWTMCIPPQESDSDMVLSNSLNDVKSLMDHIETLEKLLERTLPPLGEADYDEDTSALIAQIEQTLGIEPS